MFCFYNGDDPSRPIQPLQAVVFMSPCVTHVWKKKSLDLLAKNHTTFRQYSLGQSGMLSVPLCKDFIVCSLWLIMCRICEQSQSICIYIWNMLEVWSLLFFHRSRFCYGYNGNLAAMYDAVRSLPNMSMHSFNIPIPTSLPNAKKTCLNTFSDIFTYEYISVLYRVF
jgi:hypothetical protein